MTHYSLHLAFVAFLITVLIQAFAPRIPPTMLQAARVVQVALGAIAIYFLAAMIIQGGHV